MIIAFDVDDTLIIPSVATGLDVDTPNYETIAIYKWFQSQGHTMVIWSGSGVDWAKRWSEKLGLHGAVIMVKQKNLEVDIAFDDCDVDLGKVNVKVKRLNNSVSRSEWNKTKRSSLIRKEEERDYLTLQEVAKKFRVSERTIFRYIHEGKLRATKIGCWRITKESLKKYMNERSNI